MASTNVNYLCLGCMNMLPHPKAVCPNCGWSRKTNQGNATSQLKQEITLTNPTNGNRQGNRGGRLRYRLCCF